MSVAGDNIEQPVGIDRLGDGAVLVVGDIMCDRFITGDVTRMSPEAPVPVLNPVKTTETLGGAGNVVANLAGLGVRTYIMALTGADAAGAALRDRLSALGADIDGLLTDSARPTIVKTRFMHGHNHLLRVDEEDTTPITPAQEDMIIKHATAKCADVQAVILSDYGKGMLSNRVIGAVIAAARTHNVPVLVDPKGADYTRYRGATAVTPNRKELAEAAQTPPLKTDADIVAAARAVRRAAGIDIVLATRSEDGLSIIRGDSDDDVRHIRTEKLTVFDVSGAGDTVIATVAAALAAGLGWDDAAHLANRAGGIVVAQPGTVAITRAALADHQHAAPPSSAQPPAMNGYDGARSQIALWQAAGQRVGFTNGCFDILHFGHVSYLAQARARCDRLVVAVNADPSVRRLKGPTRPVNDESARAAVLAALAAVDLVVIFGADEAEGDTPCVVLDALRPDVIFKGGDYTEDQLPEAKIVRAYGGDVDIMPLYEGHSTTNIIKKAAQ